MKWRSLADLGQSVYWLKFEINYYTNFENFLKGYKNKFTKKLKLISGYYILHLLAVIRNLWFKQKRLRWIIDKHKEMLEELKNEKL